MKKLPGLLREFQSQNQRCTDFQVSSQVFPGIAKFYVKKNTCTGPGKNFDFFLVLTKYLEIPGGPRCKKKHVHGTWKKFDFFLVFTKYLEIPGGLRCKKKHWGKYFSYLETLKINEIFTTNTWKNSIIKEFYQVSIIWLDNDD